METARVQAGGAPKKAVVLAKVEAKASDTEMFPGLDDELMGRADNIAKEIEQADKPKVALVKTESAESGKDRAARFFATHGMMDMGHLLGDEMSADSAQSAQQEAAASKSRMEQIKGNVIEVADSP